MTAPQTSPPEPPTQPASRWRATLFVLSIGAACTAVFAATVVMTQKTVTVLRGEDAHSVETRAATVGGLLDEIGFSPAPGDVVEPPLTAALANGDIVRIVQARPVSLVIAGTEQIVQTASNVPADILAQAGITPGALDIISVNDRVLAPDALSIPISALEQIIITRSSAVTIRIRTGDGAEQTITLQTDEATVGDLLFAQGIDIFLADRVEPPPETRLLPGMAITIDRVEPVTIEADQQLVTLRTGARTVGDVLDEAGIVLMGLDFTIPALETATDGLQSIRVVRVKEQLITTLRSIPFETVIAATGAPEAAHAGREGIISVVERVRFEDGVEAGRTLVGESIVLEPVDAVIVLTSSSGDGT